MFRANPNDGQMNFMDPYLYYSHTIKEKLRRSWAPYFRQHIFNNIDEERFAVLYSNKASRPNTPVNILVGLLFLKELCSWTDNEMLDSLYFDYRVQYALGITDLEKESVSINTITNFRNRLCCYEKETGVDLLQREVDALTKALVQLSQMDISLTRQDSMMVSANCKKMNRLELVYTVNAHMVKELEKYAPEYIPPSCGHYLDKDDQNKQLYRVKKEHLEEKLVELLNESLDLYSTVPEIFQNSEAFANLSRLLEEQTVCREDKRVPREKKDIPSSSLQNPSEPDATYRKKKNQDHTGYVLDLLEARDPVKKMSIILYHEEQQNIVSDVELGQNALESPSLDGVKVIANDGGFYAPETLKKAEELQIDMVFSALTGRKAQEGILGVNEFLLHPETKAVCLCPGLKEPVNAAYDAEKQQYTAKFDKGECLACSLFQICPVKEQVKYNTLSFTENKRQLDICRSKMDTTEYMALADFRAGVEGVPSVLRRRYNIDHIPVRGLLRRGAWIHSKIIAFNFQSFFTYLREKEAELKALFQNNPEYATACG
jgi:hypothetical protein